MTLRGSRLVGRRLLQVQTHGIEELLVFDVPHLPIGPSGDVGDELA
jgi:hypothetical protein